MKGREMNFNVYSVYAYSAQNVQGSSDSKVLVDLQRLNSFKEYDDALQSVLREFGDVQVGEEKQFDFDNEVKVLIKREENLIAVGAIQNEKQIFGKYWALVQN